MIPYGKQHIDQQDINAVVDVLKSDFITQGPAVSLFENAIAEYVGAKHAIAASNATACLHLACLALGIGNNDTVWTSPISFVASANCALYCGAQIDFVDIDPQTGLMSVESLKKKLADAEQQNKLPKAIIPVHLAGQSCDMQAIYNAVAPYDIHIIEDASHAIGANYQDSKVGNCKFSDICVFSFHPVKIITTGEGGIATTNCDVLAKTLKQLSSHGVTRNPAELTEDHGPWYYEQHMLGFNYRLTDIQAALGLSQLSKLDEFVAKRNKLASLYDSRLKHVDVTQLQRDKQCYSSFHLYIINLNNPAKHKHCFEQLRHNKIGVNLHYIPIHIQPYYKKLGFKLGDFPHAERYYQSAISLPLYPDLTEQEITYICNTLNKILNTCDA